MLRSIVLFISISTVLIAYLMNSDCFSDLMLPPLPEIDFHKIWSTKNSSRTNEVRVFSIKVTEAMLGSLAEKMEKRILPPSMPESRFRYGFNSDYLEGLLKYWADGYSWRSWEDKINVFPNFLTNINGLDVHFIHVRPALKLGQRSVPLLLLHGWPGSFFEFYKVIPMLTNVSEHNDVVFEVICPSLPGFGWSEASDMPGFGISAAATTMFQLMERLNITDKFYIQGGDFGSLIAASMAKISPSKVAGIHVNLIQMATNDARYWMKMAIGAFLPRSVHFLSEEDQDLVYPYNKKLIDTISQMGYFWQHVTRPSTIGIALSDSPVGLAAYILEKFGAWSNDLQHHLDSPHGGLEDDKITLDEMLSTVMIYYWTNSISTSVRFYKESFSEIDLELGKHPVRVPVGIAFFPKELVKVPHAFAKYAYRDIRRFTRMPRGGHFAALEEPALLAEDVRMFIYGMERGPSP